MSHKQVHVITKYFYPVTAGIETNILETYSTLVNRWNIVIHTTRDEYLAHNSLPSTQTLRGLSIKRYSFKSELIGYHPIIDYTQADVIALHNFNLFFAMLFFRFLWHKITGRKSYQLIVTPHGGFNPEWSMYTLPIRIIKYCYHYTLGTFFLNYVADKIRVVSQWEKIEMVKKGVHPAKITVISNGLENEAYLDVEKYASKSIKTFVKQTGKYIIQIGRIYPIKNYETVIRALPSIPNVKYVIVGQIEKSKQYQNYQVSLQNLASELGVQDRLIFVGVVRSWDKYYLLKHAQLMVHMAIWESYCNVVHEAMSQGLVCIVANNTALPLLIKDGVNGYCVSTYDSQGLAHKVNYVLKNKSSKTVRQMQQNNRRVGQDDSWQSVAEKMYALYNSKEK